MINNIFRGIFQWFKYKTMENFYCYLSALSFLILRDSDDEYLNNIAIEIARIIRDNVFLTKEIQKDLSVVLNDMMNKFYDGKDDFRNPKILKIMQSL